MTKVTIDTTSVSKCDLAHLGGCDPLPLIRHHMGNDGLLKLISPKIREQYWQFLDCAKICDSHHMKVHFMYHALLGNQQLNLKTQAQITDLRSKYIELFMAIKSGEVKLKKVTKMFRRKWRLSRKRWQKNRSNRTHAK